MLVIRDTQFAAFQASLARSHATRLIPHVRAAIPELASSETISAAIAKAASFGIFQRDLLLPFVLVALSFKSQFPLPWMAEILKDDNLLEDAKMSLLLEELLQLPGDHSVWLTSMANQGKNA